MGLFYLALIFALALLPLWIGSVFDRAAKALEERRASRRATRAWGLGVRPLSALALAFLFGKR